MNRSKSSRKDPFSGAVLRAVERMKNWLVHIEVLVHYGGKCVCCNEKELVCLTIDHINGGGTKHRKEVGDGTQFYYWLKRNNFPDGYQVLCWNCNCSRQLNENICPHKGMVQKIRPYEQHRKHNIRIQVINHYGAICSHCDKQEVSFLTIEHKDGGNEKTKEGGSRYKLHRYIINNNFPDRFGILCYNCNSGRKINKSKITEMTELAAVIG